ncbi:hypothetical protein [Alteromonas gilva]|uniref:SCP domain-containing protein n=1 Tax=Alteromonas gilva TaxID=2987522 RepID=A0ABT5L3U5_9ALTE|nr:hypothetical protein [Alteromonas gilva]MDC8831706.1 hypothetical protein [Alteromonas gilva]
MMKLSTALMTLIVILLAANIVLYASDNFFYNKQSPVTAPVQTQGNDMSPGIKNIAEGQNHQTQNSLNETAQIKRDESQPLSAENKPAGPDVAEQTNQRSLFIKQGDKQALNFDYLESIDINSMKEIIDNIDFSAKYESTISGENALNRALHNALTEQVHILDQQAVCNNEICAIALQSDSLDSLDSTLSQLAFGEDTSQYLNGGLMRVFKDNGQYYAVMLSPKE